MGWHKTEFRGVRYRKHPTRKHGVRFDRYFQIRYQKDGKRVEEALGWASDDWTAEDAALKLAELKKAATTGEGLATMAERREKRRKTKNQEACDRLTFKEFWDNTYFPQAERDKSKETAYREKSFYNKWFSSLLGAMPLKDISPIHLEKLKQAMSKEGGAARSVQYALAVIRQVFNEARRHRVFAGENPVRQVKSPRVDNRRLRFLTKAEADALLAELLGNDRPAWEMALISLHCGLRAGEIFKLTWADIDLGRGLIAIKDSKSGRSRFAHMTERVREMLLSKKTGRPGDLLYLGPGGKVRREVPRTVQSAIVTLGFNTGREDRRDKVVFHTLRHTFASWLVQSGVDLYTVKAMMGHNSLSMTERYSHLAPENARQAARRFDVLVSKPTIPTVERGEAAKAGRGA
jgi:integrase